MRRHRKRNVRSNPRLLFFGLIVLISISLGCEGLEFSNPNSPDLSGATLQSLVTGSEAGMRIDLDVYLQVTITIGREGYFFEPADPRFTGEIIFGPVDPGGFLTLRPWSARYQVVFNCNELLSRAEELSDPQRSAVEGYAKTIRGYQLLLNLNYLDENGIRLNFDGDLTKPFATKEEAFDFIENDLNEANTALASAGDSFPFRLSDGFAGFDTPSAFARFNRAVMARVLVFRGKFDQALQALEQSFMDPAGDLNLGVFHIYGTGLGDQLNPVFQVPTAPFVKLMAHPSFEADAEPGDLRVQNKVFKRADVTVFDELQSDLAITLASTSSDPFPLIRNEELILLRAEANVGLGNFGAAEADLNIVRQAAGLDPYPAGSTNASNGLDRVLFEKRYSLFGEGHRWFDMRRYGRLDQLPIDRPARGDRVIPQMPRPETEVPD